MARPVATDFLTNSKFHVDVTAADNNPRLQRPTIATAGLPQAGFSKVGVPKATVGKVEYREGTMIYTRKFPGIPSMEDITMERGLTRGDSSFWDWLRQIIEGSGEFRADLQIKMFHRDTALNRPFQDKGIINSEMIDIQAQPARIYHVKDAFPIDHQVGSELDATNADVSIKSLTLTYERFEVEEFPPQ